MITMTVTGRRVCWTGDGDPVTTGSVGYPVVFNFDTAWDDLTKVAVFRGSGEERSRELSTDTTTIPPEVLSTPGTILWIGVRGENASGTLVIPTVWAQIGYVPEGAAEAPKSIDDYDALTNKPAIGGVTLQGNKTPAQLGLVAAQEGAGLIPDTERQQIQDNADDIADLQGEQQQQGTDLQQLQDDVDAIEAKIPNQASAQNQLADKNFVNSSINSAAAFFRGSFVSRAALLAVAWQTSDPSAPNYVSNNDYAYVQDDESQNDEAWRYIYVLQPGGSDNGWQPQFRVNESPLTAAQVAALNSGATAALIAQITANQTAIAGKITAPNAPALDQYLKWNGTAWVAAALPIYNGEVGT